MRQDIVEQARKIKAMNDKRAERLARARELASNLPKVPTLQDFVRFIKDIEVLLNRE